MAPFSRVVDVSSQEAIDGGCRQETHVQAAVVAAREAGFTFIADEIGFDSDTVARLEVRDGGVRG